tara:strand:+ start:97 stop:1857 length:1761 start_codon:yes stop_codon:yes gene_type:complete
MSLNIQKLKITLSTNLPNNTMIEFTKDVLYHPEDNSFENIEKYPYITTIQLYPESYLSQLQYDEVVNIFFNKGKFERMLIENKPKNNVDDIDFISKKNVMTMLQLLFSTKYFIVNNIHQSLDIITKKDSDNSLFYNPFNTKFSYIKLNGNPYTITKTVWLNDTVNHPKYNELIKNVHETIENYNENDPDGLDDEKKRSANAVIQFDEISYYLRNNILPKLRFPYRESSNKEIQNMINMEPIGKMNDIVDNNYPSKRDLYNELHSKLSPNQKQRYKEKLDIFSSQIGKSGNKSQYYNNIVSFLNDVDNKFYNKFNSLYERYLLNDQDIPIDNKILDIGIDNINQRSKTDPKKEIFVLLDLIEGEVNEDNKKDIECPYTNDYLGNLLNNLVYNEDSMTVLDKPRSMYSINDKKSSIANNSININTNIKNKKTKKNKNKKIVDNDLFYMQIFNKSDKENKQILDKTRSILPDFDDVIGFIQKNNKELYNIIQESLSKQTKTRLFVDVLTRLNSRYTTELNILNAKKNTPNVSPDKIQDKIQDIMKYEIYKQIIKNIMKYENKKPNTIGSGRLLKNKKKVFNNITKKNNK